MENDSPLGLMYDLIVSNERAVEGLEKSLHESQKELYDASGRKKAATKGRRWGGTDFLARCSLIHLIKKASPVLWVDTINANIERYVDYVFRPIMREFGLITDWQEQWKQVRKELRLGGNRVDFRSADRPENIEGFGYGLILINEAGIVLQDRKIWEQSILPMSIDFPDVEFFLVGTPKGKKSRKDGKKHLFFEKHSDPNWESFQFSTFQNPTLSVEAIDELITETPVHLRPQQIEGDFIDTDGLTIFPRDRWKYYTMAPKCRMIVTSWDTAGKDNNWNDYSVGETWGLLGQNFYLLDRFRGRLQFPELKTQVTENFNRIRPSKVLIEDASSGIALIQELKRSVFGRQVLAVKVDRDKVSRANAASVEQENCYLPEGEEWTEEFVSEFEDFPDGEYADQVDSGTQAINYLKQFKTKEMTPTVKSRKTRKTGDVLQGYEA